MKKRTEKRISIAVSSDHHRMIKVMASESGKSMRQFILEAVFEKIRREEDQDLLAIMTHASPVLQELWDNDRDAHYDEIT